MTPLARFLVRHVPAWAVPALLGAAYAAMLIAVVVASSNGAERIIYVDVRGR